jgi:hypothetical protein
MLCRDENDAKAESIPAHVATDVFEYIRLQGHVHVDSSNDQT